MSLTVVKYMLLASDMERAIKFYSGLGFDVLNQNPYWSELSFNNSTIALHGGHDGSNNPTGLSLQFTDVHEAFNKAIKNGGKPIQSPEQREGEPIILSQLADTEGNVIMLTQYTG